MTWRLDETIDDLHNLLRLLATKDLMSEQDYSVFVGQLKITIIKADSPDNAIQLARRWLFQMNPGRLGEYDGIRATWSAHPMRALSQPETLKTTEIANEV